VVTKDCVLHILLGHRVRKGVKNLQSQGQNVELGVSSQSLIHLSRVVGPLRHIFVTLSHFIHWLQSSCQVITLFIKL
jgi:hypothetical protein